MTNHTPSLFRETAHGLQAGEFAKEQGMNAAAEAKADLLSIARQVAIELANQFGEITADDVQAELQRLGYGPHDLGNAAGSLFRGGEWEWTGRRRKSVRVCAHANELKCWRLKHGQG